MVAGPAQQDRQAHPGQGRQEQAELDRIFHRPMGREPAFAMIIGRQRGLHAGKVLTPARKGGKGGLELAGMGPVLGIIDTDKRAAGMLEPVIERARLGLRRAGRQDKLARSGRPARAGGELRAGIGLFHEQDDVEPVGRPVEPGHGAGKARHGAGLMIERHQHRIDRQLGIGQLPYMRRAAEARRGRHGQQPGPPDHEDCKGGKARCQTGHKYRPKARSGPARPAIMGETLRPVRVQADRCGSANSSDRLARRAQ